MAYQSTQPQYFFYAESKFIFTSHFLYPNMNIPNSNHIWFNEYIIEVNSKVKYCNLRIYIRYPDCFEDMERLSELDREYVMEGCQIVYEQMLIRWTVMKMNARRHSNYLHYYLCWFQFDHIIFSVELELACKNNASSLDISQVVETAIESSESFILENIEDYASKCLIFVVRANFSLIFLFYFFFLAPSSPIAGPSWLK
jgi:hypothetical protein